MRSRVAIACFFVGFSALMLAVFAWTSCGALIHSMNQLQDERLESLAESTQPEEDVSIQIFDAQGHIKQQFGDSGPSHLAADSGDIEVQGSSWRTLVLPFANNWHRQVSLPNEERDAAVKSYLRLLELLIPATLLIITLTAFWFSGVVLGPVERKILQLRRLFSDVSHELRTPLTIALSNLQAAGLTSSTEDKRSQRLAACEDALVRMTRLIEDGLELAVSDERQLPRPSGEVFELGALVSAVVDEFEQQADAKEISLQHTAEGPFWIAADAGEIRRVLSNLIENGLRYTDRGGTVTARVQKADANHVRCTICDTGIGIPKELQRQVFNRFFRVEGSRSRQHGGAGLGLSIVKSIIEAHQGKLCLDSAPGVGTTIGFELKCH